MIQQQKINYSSRSLLESNPHPTCDAWSDTSQTARKCGKLAMKWATQLQRISTGLLNICMTMYDENFDGFLTQDELTNSMTVIMKTYGFDVESEEVKNNIAKRVYKLMQLCDADKDGQLTQHH